MDGCPRCSPDPCQCWTLTDWCKRNKIPLIESKLREKSGIHDLSTLQKVLAEDVEQIITDCRMNVGDKTIFRDAMKQLLSSPPPPLPEKIRT